MGYKQSAKRRSALRKAIMSANRPVLRYRASSKVALFGKKEEKLFSKGGKYLTEKRRKKVPARYFLDAKNRKYPYRTPDGKVSEKLLRAAYRRAKQYHRPSIAVKAKRLLKRYFKVDVSDWK